ncbi:MAG: hypothetical protein J5714_04145 [Alphaproteobacteria bacterium]|nr:hypothetical protein [Alphaproteobacteria bacterium]
MKKILLYGSILISTSALALGIDINTKIKWNSVVVVAAAHDVGLEAGDYTYYEVSLTYYRILGDLLERDKFSVADAVSVCNQECNKSAFLREGRGQSGKKCPEICKNFGNALIEENNKKTDSVDMGPMDNTRAYSPAGKVYDKNKKFYALQDAASVHNLDYDDVEKGRWNREKCTWKLFEFDTNKQIGVCDNYGEARSNNDLVGGADFKITDKRYKDAKFSLGCSAFIRNDSEVITETVCTLDVENVPANTGKLYTDDETFYALKTDKVYTYSRWGWPCSFAVFDAKNDKMVAICNDATGGLDEIDTGTGYFKIINSAYEKYEFTIRCDLRNGKEAGDCVLYVDFPGREEYFDLYEAAQKCAKDLGEVNLNDVIHAIKQDDFYGKILSDRERKGLSKVYDNLDFVHKFANYGPISFEMYSKLKTDYDKYCLNYIEEGRPSYQNVKTFISMVDRSFYKLSDYFKTQSGKFAKTQVENLSATTNKIATDIAYVTGNSFPIMDKNKLINRLHCSGDCNKFGQDYVTCTLGDLKAIFEFDDICD